MAINKTQSSFAGGIISTEMMGRIDYEKLQMGLRQCENFLVRPVGGVQYASGTQYLDTISSTPDVVCRLIPFIESKNSNYCLLFTENLIEIYDSDGVKQTQLVSTFTDEEIPLIKFAQYKNELYLTQENHAPVKILHESGVWSIIQLNFNGKYGSGATYIASITFTTSPAPSPQVLYDKWQYAASLIDNDGNETLPVYSALISNDISLSQQPITVNVGLRGTYTDFKYVYIYRVSGGVFYFVQKIAINSGQTAYSVRDCGLTIDATKSVKETFNDFDTENPRCVAFFNQRLIFGGTASKPNDIWGSHIGKFDDFTNTINLSASEAFNLTLASGTLDAIESMIPLDSLIIFSNGKIWRVDGTSASNMSAVIESYSSISELSPVATKKSILYVDGSLNTISNFVYSYELNGFVGQNLDILARELFDGYTFVAQSFRTNPFPVYFVVRDDGVMLGLTYLREENIYAWSKLTTKGKYKDVCCLSSQKNDKIFTIVERENGLFLELFTNQIAANEDVIDSCYLHSAKIVENNTSDTITGLDHLEGMTVDVVAGSDVYENRVVEDGEVTIKGLEDYSRVVVGLRYKGLIQTIPFESLDAQGGSTLGFCRKICNVTLSYYKTRGVSWGTEENNITLMKPYEETTFGYSIPLETGKFNLPVSSNWNKDTSFFVVQDKPLPCFIQNITMEIEYGSKN